jgi:nicotinamide mononucleotide adenylyltransferase
MPKGSETIKGVLEKDGFKSFSTKTVDGWTFATTEIAEKCNKIEIETPVRDITLNITLTRK